MKRFYATLALFGALITGANAQRTANISGTMITPADGVVATLSCNDSFLLTYVYVNKGPDVIQPTDTFYFFDGTTNPYKSAYRVQGETFNVNDTVFARSTYIKLSQIKFLWDGTSGAVDTTAPFNGNFNFPGIFGGFGWTSGVTPTISDNDNTDDQIAAELTINCTQTGIKDVNYNKTALNIFPNPAQNQISFTNDFATTSMAVVKITDIAGRVVKSIDLGKQNAGAKTYNVDIAELRNGMYYIELVTDNTRSISKFTKN